MSRKHRGFLLTTVTSMDVRMVSAVLVDEGNEDHSTFKIAMPKLLENIKERVGSIFVGHGGETTRRVRLLSRFSRMVL